MPFENLEISYENTAFSRDYRVDKSLENQHASFRRYWGKTPFSLSSDFTGFLVFKTTCNSELGIEEHERNSACVYNGKGKIGTFLEIPGEQSEDPIYQFTRECETFSVNNVLEGLLW